MVKLLLSLVMFLVVMRVGFAVLRGLARPVPAPPPPGEMRRVNLKYACTVCGMELQIRKAGEELPEPPRHCLEDMELVAPVE